jgi:hypothetical protein
VMPLKSAAGLTSSGRTKHARQADTIGPLAALAPRCEARRATRQFRRVNSSEIHPAPLRISRQAVWLIRSPSREGPALTAGRQKAHPSVIAGPRPRDKAPTSRLDIVSTTPPRRAS